MSDKPRSFRYTLRQLLVCMMIFGVICGYFGRQLKWKRDRNRMQMWLHPLQERSEAASTGRPLPPTRGFYVENGGTGAPWSLALIGETGVSRIEVKQQFVGTTSGYSLRKIQALFPEAEVVLSDPEVAQMPSREQLVQE